MHWTPISENAEYTRETVPVLLDEHNGKIIQ